MGYDPDARTNHHKCCRVATCACTKFTSTRPVPVPVPSADPAHTAAQPAPAAADTSDCDSQWCTMTNQQVKILPGKTWGEAKEQTQRDWFSHNCHKPAEQDNEGCGAQSQEQVMPPAVQPLATEAPAAIAPATSAPDDDEEPATTPNCDGDWCAKMMAHYSIQPGTAWGTAPEKIQHEWFGHHCHEVANQDNSNCDGSPAPAATAEDAEDDEDEDYEKGAGEMGGSGDAIHKMGKSFYRRRAMGGSRL